MLGRYVHTLSAVEAPVGMLALMHPASFELQEQRMLAFDQRPHPLASHPLAVGLELPVLKGTISVAERLDLLAHHRWLRYRDAASGEDLILPFPFMGDFLVFLLDECGPYCVNWTVKQSEEDFERSISARRRVRDPNKDKAAAQARHAIEAQYYLDAGIRTVRVVASGIPAHLANNLRNLFLYQRQRPELKHETWQELEDRLRAAIQTETPPLEVLLSMAHRHGLELEQLRSAFFWVLWERRVRVELVDEPIMIDRPLRAERSDLFKRFDKWFSREEV